jgi:hypothetical protein
LKILVGTDFRSAAKKKKELIFRFDWTFLEFAKFKKER